MERATKGLDYVSNKQVEIDTVSKAKIGILGIICLLGIAACAGPNGGGSKSVRTPKEAWKSEVVGGVVPADELARKAVSRWVYLINRDLKNAYRSISPAARAQYSEDEFIKEMGSKPILWKKVFYMDKNCPTETVCDVRVEITYNAPIPAGGNVGGGPSRLDLPSIVVDRWISLSGSWYHVPDALVKRN